MELKNRKFFHSWKGTWKCRLQSDGHFVQGEMSYVHVSQRGPSFYVQKWKLQPRVMICIWVCFLHKIVALVFIYIFWITFRHAPGLCQNMADTYSFISFATGMCRLHSIHIHMLQSLCSHQRKYKFTILNLCCWWWHNARVCKLLWDVLWVTCLIFPVCVVLCLTHSGPVMPYGISQLCHHWFR